MSHQSMTPQQIVQAENISARPPELTEKQRTFLAVVRRLADREGIPPTLAEMAEEAGIAKATAQAYVRRLKAAGALQQTKGKFRTIRPAVAA